MGSGSCSRRRFPTSLPLCWVGDCPPFAVAFPRRWSALPVQRGSLTYRVCALDMSTSMHATAVAATSCAADCRLRCRVHVWLQCSGWLHVSPLHALVVKGSFERGRAHSSGLLPAVSFWWTAQVSKRCAVPWCRHVDASRFRAPSVGPAADDGQLAVVVVVFVLVSCSVNAVDSFKVVVVI